MLKPGIGEPRVEEIEPFERSQAAQMGQAVVSKRRESQAEQFEVSQGMHTSSVRSLNCSQRRRGRAVVSASCAMLAVVYRGQSQVAMRRDGFRLVFGGRGSRAWSTRRRATMYNSLDILRGDNQ